ncbi:nitrous oxide reductase accessory protein NosL [Bergeriella denitrificans]|uniref:Dissimilatory nitrous oxide reduction protein, lipoprotein n=1 Tax=Bergeriella denitrificans TaxID=494 RepID=A0A378UIR6_BERDE|nr:nitrous oxide reductase accessory protein NosL [Bergeriella denitrificans]STZ76623.1 dissimilatory nitrous oxide reduction protein, lipoprotein [Bergeriella denitrificans]
MNNTLKALAAALLLAACGAKESSTPPPAPQPITEQAVGHYCTMNLAEHNGPKAQIFLNGKPDKPVWFSTIKQMFGYTKLPEEPKGINIIYVTDMGKVADWNTPNADNAWIDAKKAYYVIETGFVGGMGSEDALPFADKAQAEQFAKEKGGKVVGFDEMPEAYIFK